MHGKYTHSLLEFISEGSNEMIDFFIAFLFSGRNTKQFNKNLRLLQRQRFFKKNFYSDSIQENKKQARKYRLLLKQLKQDGLIAENQKNNKRILSLTSKGKTKLTTLRKRLIFSSPAVYSKEESNTQIVVIFDIPEKHRQKRNWFRSVLKNLGFSMIQKSVWVGKNKIPKQLIQDIDMLEMNNYIEIFQVVKHGTLSIQ
jgi:DNA-binding transcriptional regulator PaaX